MENGIKQVTPNPYELVEILMNNGAIYTDMAVREKYGNVAWRNWDDHAVVGWREKNREELDERSNGIS